MPLPQGLKKDKLQDLCISKFPHTICLGSFCTHTHTHTHTSESILFKDLTRTTAIILHPQVNELK